MKALLHSIALMLALTQVAVCSHVSINPLDASESTGLILTLLMSTRRGLAAVGQNCTYWKADQPDTWISGNFPGCSTATIADVTSGAGVFVAVGPTSAATGCGIWTSSDGANWSQQSCAGLTTPLSAVTYVGAKGFVAGGVCAGGLNYPSLVSPDGRTWFPGANLTFACTTGTTQVSSIAVDPTTGAWVAAHSMASTMLKSTDSGASWSNTSFSPTLTGPIKLAAQLNRIIACSANGGNSSCWYSSDAGATGWSATNLTPAFAFPFTGIAASPGSLVGVANACNMGISQDAGTNMSTASMNATCATTGIDWKGITYASNTGGVYAAAGNKTTGLNEVFAYSQGPNAWTILPVRTNTNTISAITGR